MNRRVWTNERQAAPERGAALVEMALVLGLLLLLVMGIVDLGRAYNNYMIITNASREGARYGSRYPNDGPGIISATRTEATNSGILPTDIRVTITCLNAPTGQPIRVETAYDFDTIMGGLIGVNTLTLRASTEMVVFGFD